MVKNLTSELVEIIVYSADVAQQKCDYNKTGKGPQLKIGKDFKLKEYIENGIKVEKKSPEILLAEIEEKGLKFTTKICAKTIRNNIHQGGIFDLREKDMIYKKEYKEKFKSITFDNGGEFRDYEGLERSYDKRKKGKRTIVYYAHPYCSGERGSNENNNRLIRRFIPKGTDIAPISEEYIQWIENWMNNLLRPMFGFKSSLQVA